MGWTEILMSMLGGGEGPGAASQQAASGSMAQLSQLMATLGGPSMTGVGNMPGQGGGGGQQLNPDQIRSILSMFGGGHSNKMKVNPSPTGNFQEEMM